MMDDMDCDVASDVSRGGCTSVIHSHMYITLHTSTYVAWLKVAVQSWAGLGHVRPRLTTQYTTIIDKA